MSSMDGISGRITDITDLLSIPPVTVHKNQPSILVAFIFT